MVSIPPNCAVLKQEMIDHRTYYNKCLRDHIEIKHGMSHKLHQSTEPMTKKQKAFS